jgi:glycosyltransferase involved in cell wall biosynthesis
MRVIGMMRVKNEARWIARAVRSIQPLCDRVVVFDDNSTDGTPDIARGLGAYLWYQGGNGCDEARDKNFMLDLAIGYRADWVLMIDGDEELTAASVPVLREAMKGKHKSISMDVLYLWDDEQQVRTDGVYREFSGRACSGRARRGSVSTSLPTSTVAMFRHRFAFPTIAQKRNCSITAIWTGRTGCASMRGTTRWTPTTGEKTNTGT